MSFDHLAAESVAATSRLAHRTQTAALHSVAEIADAALEGERARSANECPLVGAGAMVPDDTHPDTTSLVAAFRSSFDDLGWFRNAAVPPDFVAQSAAAELVGPDGGVPCDELRFGFFLISPNTDYVRHWHAADEHYMVLAGSASFNLDDGWEGRGAGEVIVIPSMTPHAIRTDDAAILILYSWTGDITFDTYEY